MFGGIHSFFEWGLILTEKEITSPSPKIKQIEIEGGDGVLDYTEYFGVKYNNRSLSFRFVKQSTDPEAFLELFSTVQDALHGQKMKIILDDDPAHYYFGRVTVNEWKSNKNIGEIVIEVDADPYKYNILETVVSRTVTGSTVINLKNSRMHVVPIITTDATFNFAFRGISKTVSKGTFIIPELELSEGENQVTVTGSGKVSFKYREGGL